jgi:hypothetical protein
MFRRTWNNHGMRTESGNASPNQLLFMYSHLAPLPGLLPEEEIPEGLRGVEAADDERSMVIVEPPKCPFTDRQYEIFQRNVQPFSIHDDPLPSWDDIDTVFVETLKYCLELSEFTG